MTGDSLAGQPNNPESKESITSNSPAETKRETSAVDAIKQEISPPEVSNLEIQEIATSFPEVVQGETEVSKAPESSVTKVVETTPKIEVSEVLPTVIVAPQTAESLALKQEELVAEKPLAIEKSEVLPVVVIAAQPKEILATEKVQLSPIENLGTKEESTVSEASGIIQLESLTPQIEETPSESIEITPVEAITPQIQETPSESIEITPAETITPQIEEPSVLQTSEIIPEESETIEVREAPEITYLQDVDESIREVASEPLSLSGKKRLRIFITGASGCIGHYIAETLIQETDHELYLLVRNPGKLQFDCKVRPGINVIKGDIRDHYRYEKVLQTVDCAVLAATAWGGQQEVLDVNVFKTMKLLNSLNPEACKQIIYFSTASVLDRNNQLLKEANELGTDYIRSKYETLNRITKLPIAQRITTLFPTLVLGGDAKHPYSHISSGLPGLKKWIKYIRFFKADGSFHFVHAQDIAKVVLYLVEHPRNPEDPRWLVLGNAPVTVNQAVEEACAYLKTPILFRVNLTPWIANLLIYLFNIKMAAWDRFCLEYRHFTYQNPVNPETFGLPVYCRTFKDVLEISGIGEGETASGDIDSYRQAFTEEKSASENTK